MSIGKINVAPDIVTKLRSWQQIGADSVIERAADEIERLREESKRLRAERDEVRQSYCSLMEAYRGGDGRITANKLGWGYLFEEDKP